MYGDEYCVLVVSTMLVHAGSMHLGRMLMGGLILVVDDVLRMGCR